MSWLTTRLWSFVEHVLSSLKWLARSSGSAPQQPAHLDTGLEGEDAAYFHLSRKGYQVVARRWSSGTIPGDVDLIAWQGDLLCFFEVKTRTLHDFTPAEANVDAHKRKVLRKLARSYMRQLPQSIPPQVRFDVISVYLLPGKHVEVDHFENAFTWNDHPQDWT